jgi:hypothetical protein
MSDLSEFSSVYFAGFNAYAEDDGAVDDNDDAGSNDNDDRRLPEAQR